MKLYLMQIARLQPGDIPVAAYVVQSTDGKNILIDSGFPESFVRNPVILNEELTIEMSDDDYIVNRLHTIGLRAEDIDIVICTHMDTDHAGGHAAFTNAEFIVQQSHYELARQSEHPRFAAVRDEWNRPSLRYRFVDGDTVLVPGIELIETSGHVPGHQAVLVCLPETGAVLLAIDAIPHSSMLSPEHRLIFPGDMDEAATRASTRKLVEIAGRENVQLIVHGHDSEQWKTLRHAPQFYS